MKRTALIFGAVLAIMATPALPESARPKPRPTLVSAPAPVQVPSGDPVLGATPAAQSAPIARPAAKTAPAAPVRDPSKGAVTNLPLPRFVSLKTGEGNARRGPGLSHRIDWVFTLAGMPLQITAEHEHWRRVEDAEGLGGWVHYSLLSGVRSVMVTEDMAKFYARPDPASQVAFQAEAGVVGRVIECKGGWCRVSVGSEKGWVPTTGLWGVAPDEVIE